MRFDKSAFQTFAELHPVECYELNPKRFCNYVRKSRNVKISDNMIKLLIESESIGEEKEETK